jgi:glycosyltransferase involved in cell wall biosynthesis
MTASTSRKPEWDALPDFGRRETLLRAMRHAADLFPTGIRIVETGTIRTPEGRDGDGWSTVAWAWLARELGGRLWTIDVDPAAHAVSRDLTARWSDVVEHVEADSVTSLADWKAEPDGTIDVLYLDSLDFMMEESAEVHCLQEAQAAFSHLSPHALVLMDDTWFVGPPRAHGSLRRIRGKGALAVPWLVEKGLSLEWASGRQMLLTRDGHPRSGSASVRGSKAIDRILADRLARFLWSSNAPWMPTGYGIQTRYFVPRLRKRGYEIALHCFAGLDGGPIVWEGIPLYPSGAQPFGMDILGAHAAHFNAEFVIYHTDAWVIDHGLLGPGVRMVPWFPVDSDPIPPQVVDRVRRSWRGITFSKFGQRQAREAGLDVEYVPLGVETSVYAPIDKKAARERSGMPQDAFVVGMVAMNKEVPSRKAFPQVFQAFAEFRQRHRDAVLYLHTQPRGLGGKIGIDLIALAEAHGIEGSVHFAHEYVVSMGVKDVEMATFFSALDVLVAPSLGEGFGAPILEAQACGRPVIVGGWTAMPELCFAGVQIPLAEADPYWTVLQTWQFVPRVGAIVDALEHVRGGAGRAGLDEGTARAGALAYDVETVTDAFWVPVLEKLSREQLEARAGLASAHRS